MDVDRYLSIKESARALGVSPDTIRRRIKTGDLRAEMMEGSYGKQYMIKESDLAEAQEVTEVIPVKRELAPHEIEQAIAKAMGSYMLGVQNELNALREQVAQLERQQDSRDKRLMEQIRQTMEQKEEQKKPWWKLW